MLRIYKLLLLALALAGLTGCATTTDFTTIVAAGWTHEQLNVPMRDPATLPAAPIPKTPPPPTVAADSPKREPLNMSLNEAVRITLENAKAIRVFGGLSASNSGNTIYDVAIANTNIDQQQARFDTNLMAGASHGDTNAPTFGEDATNPVGIGIVGSATQTDHVAAGLTKTNALGGQTSLQFTQDVTRQGSAGTSLVTPNILLTPVERRAVELSYTQPLLQGGGFQFNMAPIVLARLDTERSYFQFKDSTQELVRGTIEAYWNLVLARLQVWAAGIQVEQADEAYKREDGRRLVGIADVRNVAQAKVTLNQFKASLIAARANVLDREAALRNVIGLPPSDGKEIVPVSAPANLRYKAEWETLLQFAEQRRPDIIELKLILEADQQRKIQAENATLPKLDATVLYRWNGLSGTLSPAGDRFNSDLGQLNDWSVGVNFSVPLGFRSGRAQVRQQDLMILRDRANLEQGLFAASHDLAITTRTLESDFEQYLAYRETRAAALTNLLVQIEENKAGRGIYLNVLQALNDWGTAITSEAQALIGYNVLLTNLERQTGTILETHGLVFVEERFQAAGPLCLPGHERMYSKDFKPTGEPTKYPSSGAPGENLFDLKKPDVRPAKMGEPKPPEKKEEALAEPKFAEQR